MTKDYALAEMASRGTMGYVLFGAIAAGIFIFCGIFCGIVAPRSLFRGFLLGAGLTAIAGVILSVAPNLPIEPPLEPEAEASLAPLRAVMTAVNPKYLANASELEKAKADVAAAAASKDEAQKKLDGLEVKLGEETAAKTAAENTAEERAGDIEKQKAFVAAANERVQNAESVVKKLQADIETQKTTLADAGEKIKAAQAESMDAKAKLAAALEGKKRLEEASKGPGGAEEIANLKLRLELANGKVAGLQKKVLDAEAAVKAANSGMPEWLSSEELEKLRKLEGRSQARVKKLLR